MAPKRKAAPKQETASITESHHAKPPRRTYGHIQLHFQALVTYALGIEHLRKNPNPITTGFGGNFQFLTNIAFALSVLVALLGALFDVTRSRFILACQSRVLFLVTPLEVVITFCFWSIYLYDSSLVVDQRVGFLLPWYKEILFHFCPVVFCFMDHWFCPLRYFPSPHASLAFFSAFIISYRVWLQICFSKNNFWPYPILAKLDPLALYGGTAAVVLLIWGASLGINVLRDEYDSLLAKEQSLAAEEEKDSA